MPVHTTNAATVPATLTPDNHAIERFMTGLLAPLYAGGVEPPGFLSFRSFPDKGSDRSPRVMKALRLANGLEDVIADAQAIAASAARGTQDGRTLTLAPVWQVQGNAQEATLASTTLVLTLFLDADTDAAIERLVAFSEILRPSAVSASGGRTASGLEKMHAWWFLHVPSTDVARCQAIMDLLKRTLSGDKTMQVVHPMRLPGSVWAKDPAKATIARLERDEVKRYALGEIEAALRRFGAEQGMPAPAAPDAPAAQSVVGDAVQPVAASDPDSVLEQRILDGIDLHLSIRDLALRLVERRGMEPGDAIERLQDLMERSKAREDRPDDWQARLADVPRQVRGLVEQGRVMPVWEPAPQEDLDAWAEALAAARKAERDKPGAGVKKQGGRFLHRDNDVPTVQRVVVSSRHGLKEVNVLQGPPSEGKSMVCALTAVALCFNRPDLIAPDEVFPTGGCGVVMITNEDGFDEAVRRMQAIRRQHGLTEADRKHPCFIVKSPKLGAVIVAEREGRDLTVKETEAFHEIEAEIAEVQAAGENVGVLIIDTLSTSTAGIEENDNSGMAAVVGILTGVARRRNISIDLVHHISKQASQQRDKGPSITDARGASAIGNNSRSSVDVRLMFIPDTADVPESERWRWIQMRHIRNSYGPKMPVRTFYLDTRMIAVRKEDAPDDAPFFEQSAPFLRAIPPRDVPVFGLVTDEMMLAVLRGLAAAEKEGRRVPFEKGRGTEKGKAGSGLSPLVTAPTPKKPRMTRAEFVMKVQAEMVRLGLIEAEEVVDERKRTSRSWVLTDVGRQAIEAEEIPAPEAV